MLMIQLASRKAFNGCFHASDEDWRRLSANAYNTVASSSWGASAKIFEEALRKACRRSARGEISGKCSV